MIFKDNANDSPLIFVIFARVLSYLLNLCASSDLIIARIYFSVILNEFRRVFVLTHFSPVSHFYTPWKRQKTFGAFLNLLFMLSFKNQKWYFT